MSSEITLDEDLTDPDKLRPIPWLLNETVAPRIKKAGIAGGGETVTVEKPVRLRRRLATICTTLATHHCATNATGSTGHAN